MLGRRSVGYLRKRVVLGWDGQALQVVRARRDLQYNRTALYLILHRCTILGCRARKGGASRYIGAAAVGGRTRLTNTTCKLGYGALLRRKALLNGT